MHTLFICMLYLCYKVRISIIAALIAALMCALIDHIWSDYASTPTLCTMVQRCHTHNPHTSWLYNARLMHSEFWAMWNATIVSCFSLCPELSRMDHLYINASHYANQLQHLYLLIYHFNHNIYSFSIQLPLFKNIKKIFSFELIFKLQLILVMKHE